METHHLKKGMLGILILALLCEEDMYGYQITQQLGQRSEKHFKIQEGSLYPVLYRFTNSGFLSERVETVERRIRIYYHIEEAGRLYMKKCLEDYQALANGFRMVLQQSADHFGFTNDESDEELPEDK